MTNLQGQEVKPLSHPIYQKYSESEKLYEDDYWKIHTDFLVPLPIQIDIDQFKQQIEPYKQYFKSWGNNRPELNEIRKGLPLVNLSGKYDEIEDISIGPLDEHNKAHPENCFLENDFIQPTDILNLPVFDCLDNIKEYMCRSSILYWNYPANFKPHWDVVLPTVNLRLWGTDNPDNVELRYKKNEELVPCENIEAGRLYLIETSTVHDATCIQDEVFQFFIALRVDSYNKIKELINV